MRRIVVLDDYQGRAHEFADWTVLGPNVEIKYIRNHIEGKELLEALQGVEVIAVIRERTKFPRELLSQLSALKNITTSGGGNAAIDIVAANELGIIVTGASATGKTTMEFSWGLIFALTKHIVREDRAMRAGIWQETVNIDLAGATLGIAGLGKIGSSMVPFAKLLGMEVIAWSQNLKADYASSIGVTAVTKDELLSRSDVITVHLTLSDRTRGLFGDTEFAKMRPSTYLVNTSRGPIIVEEALINALKNNLIAGAGLDVFDQEPVPPGHPLLSLPNVIVTPHLGYASERRLRTWYTAMVESIGAYLQGAPINVITTQE